MDFHNEDQFPEIIVDERWEHINDNIIPGICPYYWVSDYGRVYTDYGCKMVAQYCDRNGYMKVTLNLREGYIPDKERAIVKSVHRLVLIAFNPISNYKELEVNHIDGVKSNNKLSNLEWVTSSENKQHALRLGLINGLKMRGEGGSATKLTNEQVYEISNLARTTNLSFCEIARMYGVRENAVINIVYGNTWKNLDGIVVSPEDLLKSGRTVIINDEKCSCGGFTYEEIFNICSFFEYVYTNNIQFKTQQELFRMCFIELGLDQKYDLEAKRKTMSRLLYKERSVYNWVTNQFNYNFERK